MAKQRSHWEIPSGTPLLQHDLRLRSRYSETDQMGYVYYGRYLEFFEVARTEMIRSLGIAYATLEEQGVMLPVVDASVRYLSPLRYDEAFTVRVKVFELPIVRLQTYYEVFLEAGNGPEQSDTPSAAPTQPSSFEQTSVPSTTPSALGYVSLAFMDKQTRRPTRAPEALLERIRSNVL